jgi:hypothetical protein
MRSDPDIAWLIAGIGLAFASVRLAFGIAPRLRPRWGKRGDGARMSLGSVSLGAILFGSSSTLSLESAFHLSVSPLLEILLFPIGLSFVALALRDQIRASRRT